MEKSEAASASATMPTAPEVTSASINEPISSRPMPSAPPSYEEAIGLTVPSVGAGVPGYPMAQPMQMPMPVTYAPSSGDQPSSVGQTQMPGVRVIHQHVTIALGPNPVKMGCPSCRADIKTTTMSDHQPSAHICCIILCLLGCCLCSCLPYCLSAFLSVHHFCPNCKAYIGTWKG